MDRPGAPGSAGRVAVVNDDDRSAVVVCQVAQVQQGPGDRATDFLLERSG